MSLKEPSSIKGLQASLLVELQLTNVSISWSKTATLFNATHCPCVNCPFSTTLEEWNATEECLAREQLSWPVRLFAVTSVHVADITAECIDCATGACPNDCQWIDSEGRPTPVLLARNLAPHLHIARSLAPHLHRKRATTRRTSRGFLE